MSQGLDDWRIDIIVEDMYAKGLYRERAGEESDGRAQLYHFWTHIWPELSEEEKDAAYQRTDHAQALNAAARAYESGSEEAAEKAPQGGGRRRTRRRRKHRKHRRTKRRRRRRTKRRRRRTKRCRRSRKLKTRGGFGNCGALCNTLFQKMAPKGGWCFGWKKWRGKC